MRRLLLAAVGCLLLAAPALAQPAATTAPVATQPAATTPAATTTPTATAPTSQQAAPDAKPGAPAPASDQPPPKPMVPPATWFLYGVIIVVFLGALLSLLVVRANVAASKFSLGEALSEEVTITAVDDSGKPTTTPPTSITRLSASSSRVIALMGSIVLLVLFLGFGAFVMFYYGSGQGVPAGTDDVIHFLLAGLTLFAPYVVNQFSSIFQSLSPKH